MLSIIDSENKKNDTNNIAFEDESDEDNTIKSKDKVNSDLLKNDSVNFSSLIQLLDESPDSSFQSQDTNSSFMFPFENTTTSKSINDKEYESTLKVPVLKTYSSKKSKKIPFSFDDEEYKDDEIKGESKNFTFYGKSKYNRDNLNINTAYYFPKKTGFDEKILTANINDFIRKEDILRETEDNKNLNENNNIFDEESNKEFDIQSIVENSSVKDHIMKTIEVIKNDNDNKYSSSMMDIKSFSQDFVATQKLDFDETQSSNIIQIDKQEESKRPNVINSSQLDFNIFNLKDSQNNFNQLFLNNSKSNEDQITPPVEKAYNITKATKTIFDNNIELAQSVMEITEKYKNQTIQDNNGLENIEIENETLEDSINNSSEIRNNEKNAINSDSDSSEEDYDFNKNLKRLEENGNFEKQLNKDNILSFDEWKNEYFSTSGLKIEDMDPEMIMTVYENWKHRKLSSKSNNIKEKKKKEKINKNDIEDIRKETDRLTRSSYIELPIKKTKKVTMKNFLAKYTKKNNIDLEQDDKNNNNNNNNNSNNNNNMNMNTNMNNMNNSEYMNIDSNNENNEKYNDFLSNNIVFQKNKSLQRSNHNNIQISFDDSDEEEMDIEIEKPSNYSENKSQENEAKYKTIINSLQDNNDTLTHSQMIKQLWNKTEQHTKIEREKLEKIHKNKIIKKELEKEKEQEELLNKQEKTNILKELDDEDLEVIDKNLLKKLNENKGKKELKRLKKLTFEEIEAHLKIQESKEIKNRKNEENSMTVIAENIDPNELKVIQYGSAQDNDNLAEFFQPSNSETVNNNDMSIWDKLRKNSPDLSQNEVWSAITETAVINKSNAMLTTSERSEEDNNIEMEKDNFFNVSTQNPIKKTELENNIDRKKDQDDFEKLMDINGSDEEILVPQSVGNTPIEKNNTITQTKIKNNKTEVINIIPNSIKKPNLLMSWLDKGKSKESKNNEINSQKQEKDKITDSWDNYDEDFDESLGNLSLKKPNYLISDNNINEKDDEYTVENLDDNINNYFSDDSFDLSNMLSTQNEENGSQIKPRISEEDDDENIPISIPKIKKNKKKSVFLEDEAIESEDEDLRNLGIIKDKSQDDDEDEESDDNIVYSGDEDEIDTNDIDKIIELHRKQIKDKDEKDMSAIINGVTTGNFRKRKRLNDEELEKGYDLSDDDLDIHGLRSLRRFVNRVDPHSHKHKHYKHKGALAIYASKLETAPFAKCFEINTDNIEIMEETNKFSDFETEQQEIIEDEDVDKITIDKSNNNEVDQLNKEIEELKDDHALMDGEYTTTLTIKKFEPSRITRKESSNIREIEDNMNDKALKRASLVHTVEDFINTSSIKKDFDILKYINKSSYNNKSKDDVKQMFTEPDIIDPFLANYKRKTPRIGSLLNKKEEELDRLRRFDSNLELNLGSSRKNVIGGMFNSASSLNSESVISSNNNEDILRGKYNTTSRSTSSVRPIGLLKALSRVDSNIFN
ncbi:hypothetical protein BCR36DRAFT_52802 [Piromyces finnis]|uniref:DNA replication checkpoint mediator MRC1 domain-containing protein n=1 Tax=Piromyces finnis TaxID=1754191 RepID=A0A1Y1VNH4_9FUNG|nr:hypothetical protein BCR36DRAFT_52802 [Piromyces finnis]|eukprot:ORX60181.1 hypothetical protein BCR36DRAFT_52802 [Piromyces finnis]